MAVPIITDNTCIIRDTTYAVTFKKDDSVQNTTTSAEGCTLSEIDVSATKVNAHIKDMPKDTTYQSNRWAKRETHGFRSQIASEMDNELVECSIDIFLKHYLPFEPSEAAVDSCIAKLLCNNFALVDGVSGANPRPEQVPEEPRRSAHVKTFPRPTYIERHPILSEVKLKQLEETTTCDPETTVLRFTGYMMCHGRQRLGEKSVFAPLKSIADAVGGYSETCDDRVRNSFQYLDCPDTVISSDLGNSKNKIDACFSNGGSDLNTKNIAVPIEQQASVANKYFTSDRQVISANVQIMNDDVRRTFTYGITFEDDEATLWYHCRSHSAVSKQFSFVENPKLLVKVFLSFLFATNEGVGYDPNVTPVQGQKRQYTFKIPSSDGKSAKFYRTVKVISEYRSNNISGRMARVWLVDRVDSKGKKVGSRCVLKDVWLAEDALTEKEIQTAIFADIEKFCHPDKPDYNLAPNPPPRSPDAALNNIKMRNADLVKSGEYKQYFLKIESDHAGKPSKEVLEGCPPVTGLFQNAHANRIASSNNNDVRSIGSTGFTKSCQHHKRMFTPRKQYRVIFKEVCQAVGDLPTLGQVVDVIQQTLIPLSLLYCANWVHRDISSGNILAHQLQNSGLRAKLSDLEYAKRFPLPEDHEGNVDPKTGTPFFMPVEIMQNSYLHVKTGTYTKVVSRMEDLAAVMVRQQLAEHGTQGKRPKKGKWTATSVVYNFQHDLESLWWVLVWSLTARVNHQASRTWANQIFQYGDVPTSARVDFLRPFEEQDFDANGEALEPMEDIMLPSISILSRIVDALRDAMNVAYSERERGHMLRDPLSYAIIVDLFHSGFQPLQILPSSLWKDTPLLTSISVDGPDSVQPAGATAASGAAAVSGVPLLVPGRKRPNSNNQKLARSESFPAGTGDEDVEATLERQRSKRLKRQDDPNSGGSNPSPGSSMTGRRSKSGTRSKSGDRSSSLRK